MNIANAVRELFIDIETVPAQGAAADRIKAALKESITPPASYKKLESIEEWYRTEQPAKVEEAYRKTALDGAWGNVVSISYAIDDSPVWNFHWDPIKGAAELKSESEVMEEFFNHVATMCGTTRGNYDLMPEFKIIGFNHLGFDLRFMFQRSVINQVRPSFNLQHDNRYNNARVYDVMLAWAGWGKYIKQADLCAALGIECSKGDIDGSKVWDYVLAGKVREVAEYNDNDVHDLRKCYRKMQYLPLPAAPVLPAETKDYTADVPV